jgi:hypothetical protein
MRRGRRPSNIVLERRLVRGKCVTDQPAKPITQPFWPKAVIVFGLSLTVAWIILLGYGLTQVVMHAI